MLKPPDPTFSLLLANLRWPDDEQRRHAIQCVERSTIDWARFLLLAIRHRVGPLALQGLTAARIALPQSLSEEAEEIRKRALFFEMSMAATLEQLQDMLGSKGIEAVALKGPALGTGDPAVDKEDAKVARQIESICRGC